MILTTMSIFTLSCVTEKNYTYIETVREYDLFGRASIVDEEGKNIKALSDTVAYIEAYTNFCISQKVYDDLRKKGVEGLSVPLSFKLYNDAGVDITDTEFATKTLKEEEIKSEFVNMNNDVDGSSKRNNKECKIDSVKIEELLPYFIVKKDEFDPKGTTWYKPKSAPQYTNRNGIYLYFGEQGGKLLPLRFRIQYYADDWLFIKKVQFSIDEMAYEFYPLDTERDHGSGKIWEWFDESVTGSDRELIYALSNAENAKMKFIGSQYYDIRNITQQQTLDIKRVVELYNAMGGTY